MIHKGRGFTLLEVMIATAILGGMMMASIAVMGAMADSSAELQGDTQVAQIAGRAADRIADLLRQAKQAPSDFGTTLKYRFQIPVSVVVTDAGTGSSYSRSVDNSGDLIYGALGQQGHYIQLEFVKSGRQYNETVEGRSINEDGDKTDVYDIGRIEVGYCASVDGDPYKKVPLTPDIVLWPTVSDGSDYSEEMLIGTQTVFITIMVADMGSDQPLLQMVKTQVTLRNLGSSSLNTGGDA